MTDVLQRLTAALADRYEIEREAGQGGTAVVYLARDLKHGRKVAIKVLRSELAASLGSDRFLKEIQITAQLQHPHILPLHDSGAADGILYYVMPYVDGESLRERLAREIQLPVKDALHIVREVADALNYAHEKNVVHRDIKPENIMLSGGHAMVTDFGIAQAIQLAGERTVVANDSVSGTPAYMSPEQASGGHVDARSDIYSLGCVLYEMLVGKPPFSDVTAQGLMKQILSDPPPAIRKQRDTVAEPLEHAILSALAKLPADRPSSIREFVSLLGHETDTGRMATVQTTPVRPTTSSQPASTSLPAAPARAFNPWLASVLFLGSAAVILGITFFLVQQFGLPDWVLPGAGILLIVGLPIVVVTSLVQAKNHTDTAVAQAAVGKPRERYWLTWKKALAGGVMAFAVFGLLVAGYMTSRKMGVGPGASLVSAGVLDEKSEVLIAEFENKTGDELLGEALKEALSVDLAQSTAIKVVSQDRVARVLTMMEKESDTAIDLEVAREVAVRDGITAVVAGQVVPTGSSYVLSVRLIAAETGDVLTAHRETAKDDSELIEAVDRLSYKLREKIGESLKNIRSEKSLAQVTTGSLEALQKYSSALQAIDYEQDAMRAIELLKEATEIDTTFAMAYRKLGVILNNNGMDDALVLEAITHAYELRENLTSRENYLATAYYHSYFDEHEQTLRAYENMLDLDPDDTYALNNLSVQYQRLQNHEKALELALRANEVELSANHFTNIGASLIGLGRFEEAEKNYQEYREFSDGPRTILTGAWTAFAEHDYELVESRVAEVSSMARGIPFLIRSVGFIRGSTLGVQGRLVKAQEQYAISREANAEMGDTGTVLNILLQQAWVDIMVRERTDRVEGIIDDALRQVPLESLKPVDRPYLDLADLYALIGKTDRSREYIEQFQNELDPRIRKSEEPDYHFALGTIALAEGRPREAIDHYQVAARKGNWPFNTMLGRAYDAAGEPDSALVAYETYINTPRHWRMFIDPENLGPGYYRVGQLYEEKGDRDRALFYYSKFTELWVNADADLQPRVKAAQARINALMAEKPKS